MEWGVEETLSAVFSSQQFQQSGFPTLARCCNSHCLSCFVGGVLLNVGWGRADVCLGGLLVFDVEVVS